MLREKVEVEWVLCICVWSCTLGCVRVRDCKHRCFTCKEQMHIHASLCLCLSASSSCEVKRSKLNSSRKLQFVPILQAWKGLRMCAHAYDQHYVSECKNASVHTCKWSNNAALLFLWNYFRYSRLFAELIWHNREFYNDHHCKILCLRRADKDKQTC